MKWLGYFHKADDPAMNGWAIFIRRMTSHEWLGHFKRDDDRTPKGWAIFIGTKFFYDVDTKGARKAVVSVKSGQLKADDVRALNHAREREGAITIPESDESFCR